MKDIFAIDEAKISWGMYGSIPCKTHGFILIKQEASSGIRS